MVWKVEADADDGWVSKEVQNYWDLLVNWCVLLVNSPQPLFTSHNFSTAIFTRNNLSMVMYRMQGRLITIMESL